MSQKKLMLLGGIRYLLPVIEAAHGLGAYVITADYLPGNIAHKFSDEYVDVSILDREAVLAAARERKIDGILSFGVDPGVVTAAYVAEQMSLPSPPLASVEILQNKDRFRDFLAQNGFNCPWHLQLAKDEGIDIGKLNSISCNAAYPCIVKPVDSAGSKGCSRVNTEKELAQAIEYARSESHNGRIIIEQFLEKHGSSSDTDSFSIDNELVFCSFNCQYFDAKSPNPYTPAAYSWPSDMPMAAQAELRDELQRLIRLLNLGTSIYNIETRFCTDGKAYIMELSPRGGGNRLAEVLKLATGQDMIMNCVRAALNIPCVRMTNPRYDGHFAEVIVHSNRSGRYVGIEIADDVAPCVVQKDMWLEIGDEVKGFTGANQAIGTLVLRFSSQEQMLKTISNIEYWLKVNVN